jgi:predicted DNA-binding ribbon-helix-helix protein
MVSKHTNPRNVALWDGERTTIAVEPEFWIMLTRICQDRKIPLTVLIHEIDDVRGPIPRAGALRLYVADYFYQIAMEADIYLSAQGESMNKDQAAPARSRTPAETIFHNLNGIS